MQEACEIAKRWGVEIPDDLHFSVDEYDYLDENAPARTTTFRELEGTFIDWSWFFPKKTGKIPFLIRKGILASDEAIVAVIGHEVFEPQRLRSIFPDGATIERWEAETSPANPREYPLARLGSRGRTGGEDEGNLTIMNRLVEMYEAGAITGYQVMLDCLQMLDPARPDLVLSELPAEILDEIAEYARRSDPARARAGRSLPGEDPVGPPERWIAARHVGSSGPADR